MGPNLTIIFEPGDEGWWIATIPEVPGAFSQGRTKEEARENVIDAMTELMAARRELALRNLTETTETEILPLASTSP